MNDEVYNRPVYPEKRTPVKSIRFFCIDCVCGSRHYVEQCEDAGCALHPYRLGRDPQRAGKGGNADALRKYREAKAETT